MIVGPTTSLLYATEHDTIRGIYSISMMTHEAPKKHIYYQRMKYENFIMEFFFHREHVL